MYMVSEDFKLDNFKLDDFEFILMKGILTDVSVLATLGTFLKNPNKLFKNKDFILATKFFKFFFDKKEKLPTKDEAFLLLKDDNQKKVLANVYNLVEQIDYESFDKELFYKCAEKFIKERGIWDAMMTVASRIEHNEISSSEILKIFEDICTISLDNEKGLDLYEEIDRVVESLKEKNKVISTGYKFIDTNIDGGLYADGRALYMFMAPPNKGKSLFLGNIACNIADQGKTVLMISLEMSEFAYAARFCSQQTSIPFSQLHLRTDEVKENMKFKAGKIIIKEFPPSSITVPQLKDWIKKHIIERGIKLDAIIIDYLNLFDGPGSGLYEKIKNISEQVRALSYFYQAPVITATQQNRSASGKEAAGLTSVSESSGIAMTADVIMEIYQNEEDQVTNYYRVGFAKNRYGPVNLSVITKINYETLKITDFDMSNDYTGSISPELDDSLELFSK